MKIYSIALATIAASNLFFTTANAADVVQPAPWTQESSSGYDWDGFYAGVGITGSALSNGGANLPTAYLDLIMGYNVTNESLLFGVEGWLSGYADLGGTNSTGTGAGVEGRIGYLATPDLLLYAGAGGFFYAAGGKYGALSLGTEFAVNDDVTIDANYKYWGWSNTGYTGHSVGLSANWNF